jgi:uncharacterized protein YacL
MDTQSSQSEQEAPAIDLQPGESGGYEPPSIRLAKERRSHKLLLLVVRLLFMVLLVVVTMLTVASEERSPADFELTTFVGLFIAAIAVGIIVLVIDAMLPNKRLTSVVGVYLGIGAGLLMALALGFLIDVVAEAWGLSGGRMDTYRGLTKVIIAIVLCYLAVSVVLTTKDDFRMVIPYVEFAKQVRGIRPLVLDTSVLIDGRIESFGTTGFLDAPLIVPQFVIEELQQLADSGDKMKRARGRRGLTMVGKLQENPYLDVSIDSAEVTGHAVDHMLLEMAKEQNLRILTTDYNLNKVAQIQGVTVLNINDLANTLKSQAIPGETLHIEIVKPGEGPTQGVGYMPDGTMVVVENAAEHVGTSVSLTVTNSLQTSAGRMIFGKVIEDQTDVHSQPQSSSSTSHIAKAATNQPRATERPSKIEGTPRRNPRRG